ncbi:glycosyltransferase [Pedobacter petrophilus]|uniref:Glycosyltransferase n=1 Tax=Pedobacter petrophilus TaxID=1908241 RepID=A0A7K0FX49_9SPHI|nr:glycosyltransferase family 2 protein [Pedobacter petrophilus]MRX75634.1 glycosyltransferase [Pedobacter petrophilus]
MRSPIAVIILTFNEENNINDCLESVKDFAAEIFIVDSGSTDQTLEILSEYPVQVFQHPFENYSQQRNWALQNLPITNSWVINLDADQRLTEEFKTEVNQHLNSGKLENINGFLASRKTMFMGKWIKYGGHYPTYHAMTFRLGKGVCEQKLYDQHYLVEGEMIKLKGDVIDLITESLSTFTLRHDKWSTLESVQQFSNVNSSTATISGKFKGDSMQRRRYFKNLYEKLPLFVRPVLYFIVRYFFRLGFLDGTRGLIFHFLQCFWFRFLIDAKIYELRKTKNK